ncbi:MAG: hypothetical protein LQ346_008309 [Caloplaca aetnensis]|nr:MAG: hypothetical protein LQ346_008309 [Caloplaca aetnensis]
MPMSLPDVSKANPSVQAIESYLAATESNRVCYPQTIPWPLPVKWTGNPNVLATTDLVSRVHQTLQQHNILGTAHVITSLQWRFEEPQRTVLRLYLTAEGSSESWLPVAREIHQLLPLEAQPDTLVELVNPKQVNYKRIVSTIVPESDHNYFRALRAPGIDGLLRDLGNALLSVGLFMAQEGSSISEVPCVFVFVEPGCLYDWGEAASRVRASLGDRFAVQFRPSRAHALMHDLERGRPHGLPPPGHFEPNIHTGASISAADDQKRGGTIGIFVDLVVSPSSQQTLGLPEGIHKCILTCDHVIRPGRPVSESSNPLPFNSSANPDVVYPSNRKVSDAIAALEKDMASEERDLQDLILQPASERYESRAREISPCKAMIKKYRGQLQACYDLAKRHPIGKVLFSSGLQVSGASACGHVGMAGCNQHDHHLKDCALVKLEISRSHYNKAPVMREEGYYLKEMKGIAPPVCGTRVFKYGSETGITTGLLGDEVFVRRLDVDGLFTAWPIVGDSNTAFSKPGDSASAITNESRALVGQLHSGIEDAEGFMLTYMTSIGPIFAYLEATIPGIQIRLSPYSPPVLESSRNMLSEWLPALRSILPGWEQNDSS